MLGGGFLKQAQDSANYNRQLKKDALKGSIDRKQFKFNSSESLSENDPKLTDAERKELIAKIKNEIRREWIITIVLGFLVTLILIAIVANFEKPSWL